jgi:2,4-dienoyl-CoA reductase (NADPH2)
MRRESMEHFPMLFSEFDIASLHLRNRIVMAAMGTNYSNEDGTVSDRAIAYYVERARGGRNG